MTTQRWYLNSGTVRLWHRHTAMFGGFRSYLQVIKPLVTLPQEQQHHQEAGEEEQQHHQEAGEEEQQHHQEAGEEEQQTISNNCRKISNNCRKISNNCRKISNNCRKISNN